MQEIDKALRDNRMGELEAQRRATALVEFTKAGGVRSFHFRKGILEKTGVGGR